MSFFSSISASSKPKFSVGVPTPPTTIDAASSDVVMVFDGDSLTLGTGGTGGQYYPNEVNTHYVSTFNSKTFNSFGVGGQSLRNMLSDVDTQIYPLAVEGKENILVVWEEANAILQLDNGYDNSAKVTAQENYDDMVTYCQGAKTAGFQHCIVVTGYLPRKSANGNYEISGYNVYPSSVDTMEEYCNLIKNATISSVPWDYHVDLRDAANIGGVKGQQKDATYFTDYIHLTNAGYDIVAQNVITEINKIFGL
jgi:hypothetical protein